MNKRQIKKKPFRFLWITDPWDTLDHLRDTTLRLAEEALTQGAESYWCDFHSIRFENGRALLDAAQIQQMGPSRASDSIKLGSLASLEPSYFDSIHYRTDPPVDLAYLHPLQILALGLSAPRARAKLVNPASVLCLDNEKLGAIKGLMPPSLASSQWSKLDAFGRAEGRAVLKPLHQAQSKGIELLDWRTPKSAKLIKAKIRQATHDFSQPVLLQRYLPGISQGEQRLWFIDGRLLACVRKLPLKGDFRVNLDQGSRVVRTELNQTERKAAMRMGRDLALRGIRLAAVDLIDGFVTDFNFTSPGLITQMEDVLDKNLAQKIITTLMKRA